MLVVYSLARTPDFSQHPFTSLLGGAYCEGDKWGWRQPYLEVVKGTYELLR